MVAQMPIIAGKTKTRRKYMVTTSSPTQATPTSCGSSVMPYKTFVITSIIPGQVVGAVLMTSKFLACG